MNPERLEELVAEFVERREDGESLDAEQFLRDRVVAEDERSQLRRALQGLLDAESLFPREELCGASQDLGDYRILGVLGRGATSQVYRARHREQPQREVALKVLDPTALLHPRALTRFQREGELLHGLEHPNVATLYEAGVVGDAPYLALQLLEGRSLAQLLGTARSGERPAGTSRVDALALPGTGSGAQRAARLVAKLARGVQALHERGIVHRDLKPANVVLDGDEPVLIDLGLAHGADHSTLTQSGDLLGTVPYMPPEQARGEPTDVRSDVYGLGAILHELLTWQAPHAGTEAVEVLARAQKRRVTPPSRLDPTIPDPLCRLVQRATSFRPSRRTPTAAALAEDLEAFASGLPVHASASTAIERMGDLWSVRRVELLSAGVGLIAMVLAVVFILSRPAEPTSPPDAAAAIAEAAQRAAELWSSSRDGPLDERRAAREELSATSRDLDAVAPDAPFARLLSALANDDLERSLEAEAFDAVLQGERLRRMDRHEESLERLRHAAEQEPDNPLVQAMLTLAACDHPDDEVAEGELVSALRRLPDDRIFRGELGRLLVRRAEGLMEGKSHREAEPLLVRAVELQPASAHAWQRLAFCRQALGDGDGALAAAQSLLALPIEGSEHDKALRTLAVTLDREGSRPQAVEILDGIIARDPGYVRARESLALVLDGMCRLRDAKSAYEALLDLQDDNVHALGGLANLHSGSSRESCEACQIEFADAPELYDPEAAEEYMVRYLRATRGRHPGLVWMAGQVSRAGPSEWIRETIDQMLDGEEDLTVVGRLHRVREAFED